MSEEQLKTADADSAKEEDEEVEEILEEGREAVTGGIIRSIDDSPQGSTVFGYTYGEENCDCVSCDTEVVSATNATDD